MKPSTPSTELPTTSVNPSLGKRSEAMLCPPLPQTTYHKKLPSLGEPATPSQDISGCVTSSSAGVPSPLTKEFHAKGPPQGGLPLFSLLCSASSLPRWIWRVGSPNEKMPQFGRVCLTLPWPSYGAEGKSTLTICGSRAHRLKLWWNLWSLSGRILVLQATADRN